MIVVVKTENDIPKRIENITLFIVEKYKTFDIIENLESKGYEVNPINIINLFIAEGAVNTKNLKGGDYSIILVTPFLGGKLPTVKFKRFSIFTYGKTDSFGETSLGNSINIIHNGEETFNLLEQLCKD